MHWQIVLLLLFYSGSAVKHSLRYFITSTSGVTEFPDFVAQTVVDNFQGGWCENNQAQPRNEWAKKIAEENPKEVKYHLDSCVYLTQLYRAYVEDLKQQFNQSEAQPSVFLLQKTPSSAVSCHVTGFHPENGVVFWRKDGQKLQEEVEYTEILPNHDGTFQTRADLELSSVSPEEWSRYECVFHPPGDQEDITLKLFLLHSFPSGWSVASQSSSSSSSWSSSWLSSSGKDIKMDRVQACKLL
ncbi:unnamed protein product [Tetraodon nigroviridis]|uniref:(spotted green pufferfish) hypothetical protein n=1 Tax=Tetraodon nigroviridis TaxID=99883 RepID=Q4SFR6_TETNG|nr:unnamed protein product [Tetraodon nigroviridis]